MKIYAITGGIGTGKSTALATLKSLGYPTINCDTLAKQTLFSNEKQITKILGTSILTNDRISKGKLGALIFTNKNARKRLENFIHPRVQFKVVLWVIYCFITNHKTVFVEIPLFFELRMDRFLDSLLITCDENVQKMRVTRRDGAFMVDKKIKAQVSMGEKIERATFVIYNNGSVDELVEKVKKFKVEGNS
ncbi:hypothetical protein COBT_002311, partial [Conglomerata obtusa]